MRYTYKRDIHIEEHIYGTDIYMEKHIYRGDIFIKEQIYGGTHTQRDIYTEETYI